MAIREKEKYSKKQIYYKLEEASIKNNNRLLGDSSTSMILARAMSCLPKNLVDKILKEVYFFPHNPRPQRGFYMSVPTLLEEMAGKKAIIYFDFGDDEKAVIKTILHEIAHHILNHKGGSPTGDPIEEREANDLINKWMKSKCK